jgi:outer membrane protein OmpA-like peptidoglycan-associated protein
MRQLAKTAIVGLFVSLLARAETPQLQPFPGQKSWSGYPKVTAFDEFDFPVGAPKKGETTKYERLEGKITEVRYKNPAEHSVLEIYRNYESALQEAGFQKLFSCRGWTECGGAQTMKIKGWGGCPGDSDAYCGAWKLARSEGSVYLMLAVESSSTGVFFIEPKAMQTGQVQITATAAALAGDISRQGHAAVYGIYFDTGKAEVKPDSDAALKVMADLLKQNSALKLYVVGHTDNAGALAMNMDLSRRRAAAIVKELTEKYGIVASRLQADGAGPLTPVASNRDEAGRAKNRRVELVEQ